MQKVENLNFNSVKIEGGFWKWRYDLNRKVSLHAVYERFEETGRFDALRFNYSEGKIFPHVYFDSDVAKWIEAVGYLIQEGGGGYEEEQKIIDALVVDMQKNQLPDGYLNSHFIQIELENRFTDRNLHELYCAGHLIEAAISYDKATKKHAFLEIMLKYIDCIERCFVTQKLAKFVTCGHEEIELALIKLYEYTNEKRFLDLALFFINARGVSNEKPVIEGAFNNKYDQSEVGVRDLELAEGHAVRAVYLYIAMAELALKTNDQPLKDACDRVWRDIVDKKMYITGGIGSGKAGESFTVGYDLPNLEAYSESCAAIGLALFGLSMQKFALNAEYASVIEKILYNGLLSSTSIDGRAFFYENPLEIHLDSVDKETFLCPSQRQKLPIRHRLEVFDCSCCPPNIARIIARIGDFFFSKFDQSFVVNQYGAVSYDDGETSIKMQTNYPNNGKVTLKIEKCVQKELLLRIPDWCENFVVSVPHVVKNGYISIPASRGEIQVNFEMQPYFVECNPLSRANNGRVALCYGPVVYCIEKIDNNYTLNALSVDANQVAKVGEVDGEYGMHPLRATATLDSDFNTLYRKAKADGKQVELTFRPYWTFANREECDMLVWIRRK